MQVDCGYKNVETIGFLDASLKIIIQTSFAKSSQKPNSQKNNPQYFPETIYSSLPPVSKTKTLQLKTNSGDSIQFDIY